MRIFILEDDQTRIDLFGTNLLWHRLTIAKDIYEAHKLWTPPYDIVCLDHDLGGKVYVPLTEGNTGSSFVRALLRGPLKLLTGKFFVHSWNPDGGAVMHKLLVDAGVDSTREFFGPKLFVHLNNILKGADNVN